MGLPKIKRSIVVTSEAAKKWMASRRGSTVPVKIYFFKKSEVWKTLGLGGGHMWFIVLFAEMVYIFKIFHNFTFGSSGPELEFWFYLLTEQWPHISGSRLPLLWNGENNSLLWGSNKRMYSAPWAPRPAIVGAHRWEMLHSCCLMYLTPCLEWSIFWLERARGWPNHSSERPATWEEEVSLEIPRVRFSLGHLSSHCGCSGKPHCSHHDSPGLNPRIHKVTRSCPSSLASPLYQLLLSW